PRVLGSPRGRVVPAYAARVEVPARTGPDPEREGREALLPEGDGQGCSGVPDAGRDQQVGGGGPATGQAVRDGHPVRHVSPDEPPAPPALPVAVLRGVAGLVREVDEDQHGPAPGALP